jgi:hypothetical protein
MPYEKPVVRDYGDVAEVTASVVVGDGSGNDDVTQKSSDLGVIK